MSLTSGSLSRFVALRYLRSTRRDAFITFLSISATGGICLGVAALILALGALNGFQSALREETLDRTPHLELRIPTGQDPESIRSVVLEQSGVVDAQFLVRGRVWLLAKGRARAAEMVGFGDRLPEEFPGATDRRPGVYVSNRLAEMWGLSPGEVVELASSRPTLTPLGPQPRVRRVPVSGLFTAGKSEQFERVAVPVDDARQLVGSADTQLIVRADGFQEAIEVAERLRRDLPTSVEIYTWRELNRSLFFALRLEKTLMFVAVFLIVIVAAMALVSDLMLIQASKQSEIGMLGAMGANPNRLRSIFLQLGSMLVAVGGSLGIAVGFTTAWILDRYRVLSLPDQVYFLDYVPFQVRGLDLAWILFATVLLTLLCIVVAARRISRLQPVEALKR